MKQNKLNIENIEKARKYFQEKIPEIFPIADHPIEKEEEYLQELYVSLLCSIAAFDGEVADSETIFIKRIINGIKLKTEFSQLMKKGLDINNQTVDDFINAFSGKSLAYNFIADALLLAASDGVLHDKELELIAEISEILKITQNEIDVISQFIAILTLQDQEKLSKFLEENKIPFDCEYFIKSFSLEMINTKDIDYYEGEINFKKDITFLKNIVRFEKVKVKIDEGVKLIFNGQQKVEFVNCEITGSKDNAIQISNVTEVNIIKCTFKDFVQRVFLFSNIHKALISDSYFTNCGYFYNNSESKSGGVFVFKNTNSEIINCVFDSCHISNYKDYKPDGFCGSLINSNLVISKIVYSNCATNTNCSYPFGGTKDIKKENAFSIDDKSKITEK